MHTLLNVDDRVYLSVLLNLLYKEGYDVWGATNISLGMHSKEMGLTAVLGFDPI